MMNQYLKLLCLGLCMIFTCLPFQSFGMEDAKKQNENPNRYHLPIFENINVQKDIVFGEVINSLGQKEQLGLDVYSPAGDSKKDRPVIIWIHGGGFAPGNTKTQRHMVTLATEFAKRGYVSISVDYRLRNNPQSDLIGTVTDALKDVMLAIKWVRNNYQIIGVDPNRIVVGGSSAGGILAVSLCTTERFDKKGIIALIDLWGSPPPARVGEIAPNTPPTIIIHGTEDQSVPFEYSLEMEKKLKANRVLYELHPIEGAGHTPTQFMEDIISWISEFLEKAMDKPIRAK